jgi:hypothetical protein
MRTDVVVCGAGVAGLAAAHALGALGLHVLLVDKQTTLTTAAKGEVLQPGALKILRGWNVTPRLEQRGALRLCRLVARDRVGRARMSLDYDQLPGATNWLLAQDHTLILRTLADGLPDTVDVRRGVLVSGLSRDEDGRVTGSRPTESHRGCARRSTYRPAGRTIRIGWWHWTSTTRTSNPTSPPTSPAAACGCVIRCPAAGPDSTCRPNRTNCAASTRTD